MLDFTPLREKQITWPEFVADLSQQDLADLTNGMADTILGLIKDAVDADVTFQPIDPEAHDPHAEDPAEEDIAWTLGHVIVHATASSEEGAFIAAELARGVEIEARRSRYETYWETVTTIAQCRTRLEESRRMILASLEMWPAEPHLDNHYTARSGLEVTPFIKFISGLSHADNHLGQIAEIMRQARAARGEKV